MCVSVDRTLTKPLTQLQEVWENVKNVFLQI